MFKTGTVLRLKVTSGVIHATGGELALVVDREEFPEYYQQLVDSLGEKDAQDLFVPIIWLGNFCATPPPTDGFFMKHRFEEYGVPKA